MTYIREGVPFTVPSGTCYVVTGLGAVDSNVANVQLLINGTQMAEADPTSSDANGTTSIKPMPQGLVAASLEVVSVVGGNSGNDAIVIGYVAED